MSPESNFQEQINFLGHSRDLKFNEKFPGSVMMPICWTIYNVSSTPLHFRHNCITYAIRSAVHRLHYIGSIMYTIQSRAMFIIYFNVSTYRLTHQLYRTPNEGNFVRWPPRVSAPRCRMLLEYICHDAAKSTKKTLVATFLYYLPYSICE